MNFHGFIKDESIQGQDLIPRKESIPWLESIPPKSARIGQGIGIAIVLESELAQP